jgi:hypothetical protein
VARVDDQLRAEMFEAQAAVSRWITEQKQVSDTVVLQAQRTLEADKGRQRRFPARHRPLRCPFLAASDAYHSQTMTCAENVQQLEEELEAIGAAGEALQQRESRVASNPGYPGFSAQRE